MHLDKFTADKRFAWHFVGETLRDGAPVPKDGVTMRFHGTPKLCVRGLHASRQPFDALKYAPGPNLCLVRIGGTVIEDTDKLVCTERTIIARMDATEMLRYFARMRALSVINLYPDPPDVVLDYLMNGDDALMDAAGAAAWDAAGTAARAAAWAAAGDAAGDAARAAAWRAAWAAAGGAARAAAGDAARAAAGDAARRAARTAAWAAAWRAAWDEFNALVYECFQSPIEAL